MVSVVTPGGQVRSDHQAAPYLPADLPYLVRTKLTRGRAEIAARHAPYRRFDVTARIYVTVMGVMVTMQAVTSSTTFIKTVITSTKAATVASSNTST